MRILKAAAVAVILSCLSLSAQAMSVRWELSGSLLQGGTAGGSFIYDATSMMFSDINLFTSAGSPSGGLTFTEFVADSGFSLVFQQTGIADGTSTIALSLRDIGLAMLTDAGGILTVNTFTNFAGFAEFRCTAGASGCGFVSGGFVSNWNFGGGHTLTGTPIAVPEPGTLWMLLLGYGVIAFAMRSMRT